MVVPPVDVSKYCKAKRGKTKGGCARAKSCREREMGRDRVGYQFCFVMTKS